MTNLNVIYIYIKTCNNMEHKQMTIASIIKKYNELNNSQYKPNGQALYRFLLNKGLTPRKIYFNGNAVSTFDGRNALNLMTRFIDQLKAIDDEINARVKTKQQEKLNKKNNKPTSPELELNGVKLFNENMKKKQVIRLTESDLYQIIKESVNKIMSEIKQ